MVKLKDFLPLIKSQSLFDTMEIYIYDVNYEEHDGEEFLKVRPTVYNILKYADYTVSEFWIDQYRGKDPFIIVLLKYEDFID